MKSPTFKNHALLLLVCVAVLLAARPMAAVQTEKFVNDSFEDFAEGEAHGLAIGSDGFVRLGLEAVKWAPLTTPVIWAAVQDASGVLFVAAGNEGQVFRIGANGKAEEYFKAGELQVQALALGPDGALYAASMPDGKIYRVEAKGRSSLFFDPKEKYIWALQFTPSGDLFAATGDKGKLYKISSSGKGHVFYDSDETHLRTMRLDAAGRLWVGSEGNGLVYRFDQLRGSEGAPFVAYDSTFREIKALAVAPDGSVFVGAMGDGKAPPRLLPFAPKGAPTSGASSNAAIATLGAMISMAQDGARAGEMSATTLTVEKPGAGEIVRILPDGSTEKWWDDGEDVYALAVGEDGHLWAGTGRKGRVLEFVAARQWNVVAQLEAETVSALLRRPHGGWLAATSNAGALWTFAASPGRKGTFESKVFDAHASARWGTLDFQATGGRGHVALFTRSGNTAKPDKVWSDWSPLNAQGRVQSPVAGHLQYRLEIEAEGGAGATVAVDSITLFYQPKNQSPSITRINVFPSNIELVRMPKMEGPLPPLNVAPSGTANGHSPKMTGAEGMMAAMMAVAKMPTFQQVRRLGWRSAIWQASDPDNDTLSFDVSYRAAGAERWKVLKEGVKDNFLDWAAATWPDGAYYLRVMASDLPDNREDEARTGEWTSDVFTVDNTAPEIQADLSAEALAKGSLALTISDSTSVVDQAEYSLDGADWRPLLPVGGIYDAKSNRFLIPIQRLKAGEHYVVVRASDAADNVASRTIHFTK